MSCKTCKNCNVNIKDDNYEQIRDYTICSDCNSQYEFATCESCNNLIKADDSKELEDDILCADCYNKLSAKCFLCDEMFYKDSMMQVQNELVCKYCADDETAYCSYCDNRFFISDLDYRESDGFYYCCECWNEQRTIYRYVDGNWTFYNLPTEHGTKKHPLLYYGIELETGILCSATKGVGWFVNQIPEEMFAIHEDGSIMDSEGDDIEAGLEIVSHPMTYKYIMKNKNIWTTILDMRKYGLCSLKLETCAIHIQINKDYFATNHLRRFLEFMYNEQNRDFIETISQRDKMGDTCLYRSRFNGRDINIKEFVASKYSYEKHIAVNLRHHNTIEIRIFKGVLKPQYFWKNIEFVEALIRFSKKYKLCDMKAPKFMRYVKDNKQEFSNLFEFIGSHIDKIKNHDKQVENCDLVGDITER